MAEPQKPGAEPANPASSAATSTAPPRPEAPKQNAAFRMLGLPNIRFRLPSRNWCIFLGVVGSWTAAVTYDRYEKKRIIRKWSTLVEDQSREALPTDTMARKLTVYLAAPPGDGLRCAREHFFEYIKPVLAAASLDWDVVEGRREGEVRAGTAERIRKFRRRQGEYATTPLEMDKVAAVEAMRQRVGTKEWPGAQGDLIVGRHTWKEYVRGVHEGWLGPLDAPVPVEPVPVPIQEEKKADTTPTSNIPATPDPEIPATPQATPLTSDESIEGVKSDSNTPKSATDADAEAENKDGDKKEEEKPKKPAFTPAFISAAEYDAHPVAPTTPQKLGPSAAVHFPHILGFRNTPIRMWRFLNQRHVAEEVGKQVAAAVLSTHRPYETATEGGNAEQNLILAKEEKNWMAKFITRVDDAEERPWIDEMKLDSRIAERMQKFELSADDDDRAKQITRGQWKSQVQREKEEAAKSS